MARAPSPGFDALARAVARCSEEGGSSLRAWQYAAFVGLSPTEASRVAQTSGCSVPVGGPEWTALQNVCAFYTNGEAMKGAVSQLTPLLPQLFDVGDLSGDASLPVDMHNALCVVRWADAFKAHLVGSMRRLRNAGCTNEAPSPAAGVLDEGQCAGGLVALEAAGTALLSASSRDAAGGGGAAECSATAVAASSVQAATPRSSWCAFFGLLAFAISCTTRIQQLLLGVHSHAMTGDVIHVVRAAAWMKSAHALLHRYADHVVAWDRASKLGLLNASSMAQLASRFQALCVVFQRDRMGTVRRLVDLFGMLWGRCSLLFSDCLDVPYATTYDDAVSPPEIVSTSAASSAVTASSSAKDGPMDGTHPSGTHAPDDSDCNVSPLLPSLSSVPSTRGASPVASQSQPQQPQPHRGGGGGVASRIFNFVKRGRTEPARVQVPATAAREQTMHQQLAMPTTSSIHQAAVVQAHSRHNLLCRTLSERGSEPLATRLASFYLLTQRPGIRRATFLLILDNSGRTGPCLWRHGTLVPSATHDVPSERSPAQCWTLCYSSDGMRGSTAHVKMTWHLLQSFVFLLAGADGDFLETTHHTQHLLAQRVVGFDVGNLFACIVMDVHNPTTTFAANASSSTGSTTGAAMGAAAAGGAHQATPSPLPPTQQAAAAPLDPASIKAERSLARHLLQSFAETWCGPMQWVT